MSVINLVSKFFSHKHKINLLFIFLSISGSIIFSYALFKDFLMDDQTAPKFHYLKYYFLSFIIFILGFFSLSLKKIYRINILIVIFSILISLYGVEFFIGFKTKNTILHYQKILEKNKNAVLTNNPGYLYNKKNPHIEYYYLSGISNEYTIHCNENNYVSSYLSDRYGYNNPDLIWDKSNKIILVGDSHTHGNCVNYENTLAGNLNKLLKVENVISLGYQSYGPLSEYASIKEYLFKEDVDKIVWIYYEGNDLELLNSNYKSPILKNYINADYKQNLIEIEKFKNFKLRKELPKRIKYLNNKLENKILTKFTSFLKLYSIRNLIKTFYNSDDYSYYEKIAYKKYNDEVYKIFNKLITNYKEFALNKNVEIYFVYIPDFYRTFTQRFEDKDMFNYEKIINIINNNRIEVIDINKSLMSIHDDPLSLYPNRSFNHFNENGYYLIAEVIYDSIKK